MIEKIRRRIKRRKQKNNSRPARRDALESAATGACAAPMEMLERCAEVCAVLEEMLEKGSTLLISDVGCAALLCRAAMESAAMNVYVNTRLLRDRGRVTEIEARAETLTAGCSARAESIALSVKNRLKGGEHG